MVAFERPDKKKPDVPQEPPAPQLDELSGNQIAALAAEAGMTREAYERSMQKRARDERVAKTVDDVQRQLASGTEKTVYDKQAEIAVMGGIRKMRDRIERPDVSEKQEEMFYGRAYEEMNKIEEDAADPEKVDHHRRQAVANFGRAIRARAIRELFEQIHKGVPYGEAKRIVVQSFSENAGKQNIPELAVAYADQAQYIGEMIERQQTWAAIDPLIANYDSEKMTQEDKELLQNLIAFAKAAYFKGGSNFKMLERFGLQKLDDYADYVVTAYRTSGPHKTTANNTSGAAETYGSIQSGDRNMGYNRTGKRRPHRGTPDDERF